MPSDLGNITENDIAYEEELLRDPYQLKTWLRYIGSKRESLPTVRYQLYERALKVMPGRFELQKHRRGSCS
jgi:pre-mRNA-splicing factor SYF1